MVAEAHGGNRIEGGAARCSPKRLPGTAAEEVETEEEREEEDGKEGREETAAEEGPELCLTPWALALTMAMSAPKRWKSCIPSTAASGPCCCTNPRPLHPKGGCSRLLSTRTARNAHRRRDRGHGNFLSRGTPKAAVLAKTSLSEPKSSKRETATNLSEGAACHNKPA